MMKQKSLVALLGAGGLCGAALGLHFWLNGVAAPAPAPSGASQASPDAGVPEVDAAALTATLQRVLAGYRQVLVLFADERTLSATERATVEQVGRGIYYENQARLARLDDTLSTLITSSHPSRLTTLSRVLNWIETGDGLFDADRLAFREVLRTLQVAIRADSSLPAVKLHRQISEDLTALDEIEHLYDKELKRIFARFEERGIVVQRQRWDEYIAKLKTLYSREQILRDYGKIVPYPKKDGTRSDVHDEAREITGRGLPPKTLVLTFDDGPHRTYTEEIAALLKQYGIPGLFFELGQNLGTVNSDGTAKLGRLADKSRMLLQAGFVLGNHSYRHGDLSREDDAGLTEEVSKTQVLLQAIHGDPDGA